MVVKRSGATGTTLHRHIVRITVVVVLSLCSSSSAAVTVDQCKDQETQAVAINAYGRRLSIDDASTPFYQVGDLLSCFTR